MSRDLTFRWLGIAGIELSAGDQTLVIDPYLTRIPFWRQWFGRIQPDRVLIQEKIQACDHLLVTHAHYDHLLDAPVIAITTGATVYGSANTCQLLEILDVPGDQIHEIRGGDMLTLGRFTVQVFRTTHLRLPVFTPGKLAADLHPPLRAGDYRMDDQFCYRIRVAGCSILTDPGVKPEEAPAADILWLHPLHPDAHLREVIRSVRPKMVIPNHWDDLWRPLGKPLRPMIRPPRWGFPPIQRVNLRDFQRSVEGVDPSIQVFLPEIFKRYPLFDLTQ